MIHDRPNELLKEMEVLEQAMQRVVDKDAIIDIVHRFCRGVDRSDRAILEACFWPGAYDDHIAYVGDDKGVIDFIISAADGISTSHMISNIVIDFRNAGLAHCESYYLAYHDLPDTEGRRDWVLGGRYLDWFEKRGDEWRIIRRVCVVDFQAGAPQTASWGEGWLADLRNRGARRPADPLYASLELRVSDFKA